MSFESDLEAFHRKLEKRARLVFFGCTAAVHESVTDGHAATGAPGQPRDTGYLRASWLVGFGQFPSFKLNGEGDALDPGWRQKARGAFPAPDMSKPQSFVVTNTVYAPPIEAGAGPHGALTLRSTKGGFHSVELTRTHWPRLVEHVARAVVGGGSTSGVEGFIP